MLDAFTVDGRIVTREYPAYDNYVDDGMRAYLLDGQNQYYFEDDKAWHQVVNEIDYVPLALRVENKYADGKDDKADKQKVRNQLFNLTFRKKEAEQYAKAKQTDNYNRIFTIICVILGTVLLISGIIVMKG